MHGRRDIGDDFHPRKPLPSKTAGNVALDPIDSEILRLLREDGRMSWRDLGAAVGLSANAASDRVRRLRQARRDHRLRRARSIPPPAAGTSRR